jgi:hypothetical protein
VRLSLLGCEFSAELVQRLEYITTTDLTFNQTEWTKDQVQLWWPKQKDTSQRNWWLSINYGVLGVKEHSRDRYSRGTSMIGSRAWVGQPLPIHVLLLVLVALPFLYTRHVRDRKQIRDGGNESSSREFHSTRPLSSQRAQNARWSPNLSLLLPHERFEFTKIA